MCSVIQMFQYLHAGTVGFAADQSRWDVRVRELVVQVDHVGHPAGQEELVPLHLTRPEHHTVDVPTWGGRRRTKMMKMMTMMTMKAFHSSMSSSVLNTNE